MTPIFASEITNFTPPGEIAVWLACACFAMWLFLLVRKVVSSIRGNEPQPPNSALGQSFKELRRRIEQLEVWKEAIVRKMEEDKLEILAAGEVRGEKIHSRINEVLTKVSELRGEMRRHH